MSFKYQYNYDLFVKDANDLVKRSNNKFNLCSANIKNNILQFYYLKSNLSIFQDKYILDLNIIFSETYQLPVLYFNIYKSNSDQEEESNTISVINYKDLINNENFKSEMVKYCELSRENNPFTGINSEYLHLCQLNQLINSIENINNILIFWLSIVLQIFNLDLTKILNK